MLLVRRIERIAYDIAPEEDPDSVSELLVLAAQLERLVGKLGKPRGRKGPKL